jgi:hypothetical protein
MRRIILWSVTILITFAIGTGFDSLRRYLFTEKSPAVAKLEAAPLEIDVPEVEKAPPLPEPAAPAPNLIFDYNREKVNHYGALYIMGPAPEGFKDFSYIEFAAPGVHESSGYITVYTENFSQWAPADFALVTERYLYFTTEPGKEKGFQYRFEGEFLIKNFDSVEGKNKGAVRGKLTKSLNGKTLAEQTVTFRVEYMGC